MRAATTAERRVNVREDYGAFLAAKATPGARFDGDHAILPGWDSASVGVAEAVTMMAPHLHEYQRFAVTFAVARQRAESDTYHQGSFALPESKDAA